MDIFLKIIYMADTVLIHYQIPSFCLFVIAGYHAWKNDAKTVIKKVTAFCISIALLIGIPMGIAEASLQKLTSGDAETVIMKEVSSWIS